MSLVIAMGEVEAGDVHTGINKCLELRDLPASWPESTDDLGATTVHIRRLLYHIESDEAARERWYISSVGDHRSTNSLDSMEEDELRLGGEKAEKRQTAKLPNCYYCTVLKDARVTCEHRVNQEHMNVVKVCASSGGAR